MKNENLKKKQTKIDKSINLSAFQKEFMKDVLYFQTNNGEYKYYKKYVAKKYANEELSPEEIQNQIDELVDESLLYKSTRKSLYKNRYSTTVLYEILHLDSAYKLDSRLKEDEDEDEDKDNGKETINPVESLMKILDKNYKEKQIEKNDDWFDEMLNE